MSEGLSLILGRAWIDNTGFPVEKIIKYNDSIEYTPYSLTENHIQ